MIARFALYFFASMLAPASPAFAAEEGGFGAYLNEKEAEKKELQIGSRKREEPKKKKKAHLIQ